MATCIDLEQAVLGVLGEGKMAQPAFQKNHEPDLPYACLQPYEYHLAHGSDHVWTYSCAYDVILCTRTRDRSLEMQMLDALDAHGILLRDVLPSYDPDERLMLVTFVTEPVTEVLDDDD
jgi:hypothetical protein